MTRKHHLSPTLQLREARINLRLAFDRCPHWDWDGDGTSGLPCCIDVAQARAAVAAARDRKTRDDHQHA